LKQAVENLELRLLKEALEESRYNQRKAAAMLGLTYHQLRGMLRKYKAHMPQKRVLTSGGRS
jgi:psp operon transcriptional activator